MTQTTDALVSELRVWAQSVGVPSRLSQCLTEAADTIDRLTRERDEARNALEDEITRADNHASCLRVQQARAEAAEAALLAARAERDEWKAKAAVAFQEACTEIKDLRRWANNKGGMFHPEEYVEGIAMIRALKEAPHE